MRSGTTAFRQALASNRKIASLGEIFHSNFENDAFSFHKFYLSQVQGNPELALPSPENRETLFLGFLDYLNTRLKLADKPDRVLLLGVNYNSIHSLNYYWQNPCSPPHMLSLFRKMGIGVIHIRRLNILETLVSEARARKSGIWHMKAGAEQPPVPVELNTRTLLAELEERTLEIRLLRQWLAPGKVLELTYEEIFEPDNRLSQAVLGKCAAFLGVPPQFEASVNYRRTGFSDLRQAISNYGAVAELLSGTAFARFLGERQEQPLPSNA